MEKELRRDMFVRLDRDIAWDDSCRHDLQLSSIIGVDAVMASVKDGSPGCLVVTADGLVWALPQLTAREAVTFVRCCFKRRRKKNAANTLVIICRYVHEGVDYLGWRKP